VGGGGVGAGTGAVAPVNLEANDCFKGKSSPGSLLSWRGEDVGDASICCCFERFKRREPMLF